MPTRPMGSQQTVLRKGKAFPIPDDEVVEHPDVHQGQSFPQSPGNLLVSRAGLRHPGRVIVSDDHGCSIVQ